MHLPNQIALLLCLAFIIYCLRQDLKESRGSSPFLWIPFVWMAISASKPITFWLYPRFNPLFDSADYMPMGGYALERNPLIIMMALGLIALYKRRDLIRIDFRKSSYLWLFFFYLLMSTSWTDYQGASLKKWMRAVGDIIMVLVILTDKDPEEATVRLLRRLAIVLIPLSVLFIRYYRYIGVMFDRSLGTGMYVGVTRHKNHLGQLCAFLGILLLWRIIKARPKVNPVDAFLMLLVLYLLVLANSITSIMVFLIGAIVLVFDRLFHSDLRRINRAVVVAVLFLAVFQIFFVSIAGESLSARFFAITGRNASLTDRIPLWKDLIQMGNRHALVGSGLGGFWDPERITTIWDKYPWGPLAAHNGYLDIFLDLGLVGLFIFLLVAFQGHRIILASSESGNRLRTLKYIFFMTILLHNFTESTLLKAASFMWQLFLLSIIVVERKDAPGEDLGDAESHAA
jgi:exopolysaccharide production protein ExoQ